MLSFHSTEMHLDSFYILTIKRVPVTWLYPTLSNNHFILQICTPTVWLIMISTTGSLIEEKCYTLRCRIIEWKVIRPRRGGAHLHKCIKRCAKYLMPTFVIVKLHMAHKNCNREVFAFKCMTFCPPVNEMAFCNTILL